MERVQFGKTNQYVSELSLGCLNFGTKTNQELSYKLMDEFIDQNGNFLDTANNYAFWEKGASGGESEELLGNYMKERKNRNALFVATKIGAMPNDISKGFEDLEGLSKQSIFSAVDKCLRRLQTNHIDLLYAHVDDSSVNIEETLDAWEILIKAGKVLNIGCSNFSVDRLLETKAVADYKKLPMYSCLQQRITYLQPKVEHDFGVQKYIGYDELMNIANELEIQLLAFSPLLGGYYNKLKNIPQAYDTSDNKVRMRELIKISSEIGCSNNQFVIKWLLENSPRIIPLIAASNIEQLRENMSATNYVKR